MDSSFNDSTTDDSGDFWAKEDAEAREVEAATYRRAQRILRNQAYMERPKRGKYKPSAMDEMLTDACGALETIDGGITQLSFLAFGNAKPPQTNSPRENKGERKIENEEQRRAPLTKEEIEAYELEALQALVEGREPNIPDDLKNGTRALDPPTGFYEDEEMELELTKQIQSAVDNDEASDLRELEIEINHYVDMIDKYNQMEARKRRDDIMGTRKRQDDLMEAIKEVERRHEEQQLEQFQYRRQNMTRSHEQQIWTYVGEYYTGGATGSRNPTRVAPSPENMLGRMAPRRETEESREARVSKMLDALDNRIAMQAAARAQQNDDDEFENALQRRQQKRDMYEKSILLGLLQDLQLIDGDDESDSSENSQSKEKNLSSTLDDLDKKFYNEIKEAAKEEYDGSNSSGERKEDTGIVAAKVDEQGAMFDNGCLGCGQEEEDPGTINGVPRTVDDSTNVIDSQHGVYSPINDQVSDASESSSNKQSRTNYQQDKQDPPENSWFPFFSSTPKKREIVIPAEITLGDPPEEVREKPEGVMPSQVHVKKGLKIVAILEDDNNTEEVKAREVKHGSSSKPIMVREDPSEATGPTGCWAGSQHHLLTSE